MGVQSVHVPVQPPRLDVGVQSVHVPVHPPRLEKLSRAKSKQTRCKSIFEMIKAAGRQEHHDVAIKDTSMRAQRYEHDTQGAAQGDRNPPPRGIGVS